MKKNINDLRTILFDTMDDLRSGKIDVERAKQIGSIGQVIVNSAIVEVKHIRESGGIGSGFIESAPSTPAMARLSTLSEHEKTVNKYIN